MAERAIHFLTAEARVLCGAKLSVLGTGNVEHVTCGTCRRRLPPAPVEFTPRYHVNETLQPCPDCSGLANDQPIPGCTTCGGVGLVYVTGTPSTENDASPT